MTQFTVRELRFERSADPRSFTSFFDALAAGRLLSAGRAPGLAVYQPAEGVYELRAVDVRDIERESWTDPVTRKWQAATVRESSQEFGAGDIVEPGWRGTTWAQVLDRRLVAVVDEGWAMQTEIDPNYGTARLVPYG